MDVSWPDFHVWRFQLNKINDSWIDTAELFWRIEPLMTKLVVDFGYSDFIFVFDERSKFEAAIKILEQHNVQYTVF